MPAEAFEGVMGTAENAAVLTRRSIAAHAMPVQVSKAAIKDVCTTAKVSVFQ